jgi:hypothetical protein
MLRISPSTSPALARLSGTPLLPGPRVYLTALVLFAAMIGGLEAYWRSREFRPSVPDSADLWSYHWSQVVGNDPNLIVAIGTSRIRTDVRADAIREWVPADSSCATFLRL